MDGCIFCKIIKKEIPAEVLHESKNAVIIKDIHPKAPVHYLAVLKQHIPSVKDISSDNEVLMGDLIKTAKESAEKLGLNGYKLIFNVGREGGQVIDHIHLHILGGWNKNDAKIVDV